MTRITLAALMECWAYCLSIDRLTPDSDSTVEIADEIIQRQARVIEVLREALEKLLKGAVFLDVETGTRLIQDALSLDFGQLRDPRGVEAILKSSEEKSRLAALPEPGPVYGED